MVSPNLADKLGETIKLVTNAQAMLASSNLRLHKVDVMKALPAEDRPKSVSDLDLRRDRCTANTTFPWGPLGYRERQFHLPCFIARKALHAERSVVHHKLCVRPTRARISSNLGRQANTTATRHHGKEGQQQQSPWLGRPTPGE